MDGLGAIATMSINEAGYDSDAPESVSPPRPPKWLPTAAERLAAPFEPTPKKKPKPPKRTQVERKADRLKSIEQNSEPDDIAPHRAKLPIDLEGNPKVAVVNAFLNELQRRVKCGGNGIGKFESKFTRLIRQVVNQALLGDKDSQKLLFENVRGRLPVAESEERTQNIAIINKIPAPREPKPLPLLPAEEVKVVEVGDILDVQSEPVPDSLPPEPGEI